MIERRAMTYLQSQASEWWSGDLNPNISDFSVFLFTVQTVTWITFKL